MDLNLANKTVLVTGGSMGMGAAFVEAFAQEGSDVAVNYIVEPEQAEAFAQKIRDTYHTGALAVYADITDEQQVSSMIDKIVEEFGHLDVLVNNAGIWPTTPFLDISLAEWKKVIEVNLNGAFICCKAVCKQMIKQGHGGHIVNINSKSGISVTSGGHAHYVTSKGGITLLTKAVAREMSGEGIIVNCVVPGMVATPMNQAERDDPKMMEYYINRLPLKKFSDPADIANMVVFLASDRAYHTAGAIVDVTGGLLL
jgi:Dehydrogenases with different specificities (related to short-chain alcohol dehydrogenases)